METRSSKGKPRSALRTQRRLFSAFSAISAVIVGSALIAFAQLPERARTEELARRATERLQSLQREADRLASEERTPLGDLRKLELERQIKAEELRQVAPGHSRGAAPLGPTPRRMGPYQGEALAPPPHRRQPP